VNTKKCENKEQQPTQEGVYRPRMPEYDSSGRRIEEAASLPGKSFEHEVMESALQQRLAVYRKINDEKKAAEAARKQGEDIERSKKIVASDSARRLERLSRAAYEAPVNDKLLSQTMAKYRKLSSSDMGDSSGEVGSIVIITKVASGGYAENEPAFHDYEGPIQGAELAKVTDNFNKIAARYGTKDLSKKAFSSLVKLLCRATGEKVPPSDRDLEAAFILADEDKGGTVSFLVHLFCTFMSHTALHCLRLIWWSFFIFTSLLKRVMLLD